MAAQVERYETGDPEIAEAWQRCCDDPELQGADATRLSAGGDWPWQVGISAAEFVRGDPLESDLRKRVKAALREVSGVADVAEEDREVWLVAGSPTGPDLVRAVASVLDALEPSIRSALEG